MTSLPPYLNFHDIVTNNDVRAYVVHLMSPKTKLTSVRVSLHN